MASKRFARSKGDRKLSVEASRSEALIPKPNDYIFHKQHNAIVSLPSQRVCTIAIADVPSTHDIQSYSCNEIIQQDDKEFRSARAFYQVEDKPPSAGLLCGSATVAHDGQNASTTITSRSRSNTAPSNPSLEDASQPCELPGSLPMQSSPSKLKDEIVTTYINHATSGWSTERPHSSPNLHSTSFSAPLQRPCIENSFNGIIQSNDNNSLRYTEPTSAAIIPQGSITPTSLISQSSTPQPMLAGMQSAGLSYERPFQIPAYSQMEVARADVNAGNVETVLMQQISAMRVSHDAYLTSLKAAHEQEVASHRSYIAFLEKRQLTACPELPLASTHSHNLKLDTNRASTLPSELPGLDVSPTNSQAGQPSQSSRKPSEQEAQQTNTETIALRRKLSLVLKEKIDSADISRERDQLKDALETKDRKISQLKDIVSRAKDNEKILRNSIKKLEASLEIANDERVDALDCFQQLNSDLVSIRNAHSKLKQQTTAARVVRFEDDTSITTIAELKAKLKKKEVVIANFERQQQQIEQQRRLKASIDEHNEARLRDLQSNIEQSHQLRLKAELERDQYNSLLHVELRKQAEQASQNAQVITPALAEKASKQLQAIIHQDGTWGTNESTTAKLEKHLEQCLKDIIVYKLEMRGYQRDIKKLSNELKSYRALASQRPPTPESDAVSRKDSSDSNSSIVDGMGNRRSEKRQNMMVTIGTSQKPTFSSPARSEVSPSTQQKEIMGSEMSHRSYKPRPAALDLIPAAPKPRITTADKEKATLKPLASYITSIPQPQLKSPPSQAQLHVQSPRSQMQSRSRTSPRFREGTTNQQSMPYMAMKATKIETDRSLSGTVISSYASTPPPPYFIETTS